MKFHTWLIRKSEACHRTVPPVKHTGLGGHVPPCPAASVAYGTRAQTHACTHTRAHTLTCTHTHMHTHYNQLFSMLPYELFSLFPSSHIIQTPPSHQRRPTFPPHDFSFSQPEGEYGYAILEGRASVLDQQRHMRRIDSCSSFDSYFHHYLIENQRHYLPLPKVDLPPNCAQFRPVVDVQVSIDDEDDTGYEILNRQQSASSHMSRATRERGMSQSPSRSDTSPRNPSPLFMKSITSSSAKNYPSQQQLSAPQGSSVAVTTSSDYIIQQDHISGLTASDCQFRPIPVNKTQTPPWTLSDGERYMSKPPSGSNIAHPLSTTPGGRHRINSQGSGGELCEPKIMSPLSPTRKVPPVTHKLPNRRNESLV